ncbi:MAG: hypothetical protein H5T69_02785 [Chloroflexi bacterium]|nr:hypothetical protein [Chloroflexota bacterium]
MQHTYKGKAIWQGLLLLVLLWPLTLSARSVSAEPSAPDRLWQQGIAYVPWAGIRYDDPNADLMLERLVIVGADWISVSVPLLQDNYASTKVYITADTPSEDELTHVITAAHRRGLQVMLKIHLYLANDPDRWHGQVGEAFERDRDWNRWFTSYGSWVMRYAELAERLGVDQFCVGTELGGTAQQKRYWSRLIKGVRQRYHGPITYAANHGEEVMVNWWDQVDYIGVDGYYPLTDRYEATADEIKAGWAPHIETLTQLFARWGKPILLTEIGYASEDGCTTHPWVWTGSGTAIDLDEQAAAYQAMFESLSQQPWFAGLFVWAVTTDPSQGGEKCDGFTPMGKPAESILAEWYGGTVSTTDTRLPTVDHTRALDIYTDGLGEDWHNVSWAAAVDFYSTETPYSGSYTIVARMESWGAISLLHEPLDTTGYAYVEFYIRPAMDDAPFWVYFYDDRDTELRRQLIQPGSYYIEGGHLVASAWQRVLVPLEHLDAANRRVISFTIQEASGSSATIAVDDIRLVAA